MPLVKRLVQLLGGCASVSSREGEGTTVYLSLPFKVPDTTQQIAECLPHQESPRPSQPKKVLVVDDDEATRLHIERLLSKQGWEVYTAENGEQALVELAKGEFDCVLMDVQMPVLDGIEATTRIRSSQAGYRGIPIIAVTAYAMAGDREGFLAAGMDDYIAKPIDNDELIAVLERNLSV